MAQPSDSEALLLLKVFTKLRLFPENFHSLTLGPFASVTNAIN